MESVCPACGAENDPMGFLGRRAHYRCRCCGWMWSMLDRECDASEPADESFADDLGVVAG